MAIVRLKSFDMIRAFYQSPEVSISANTSTTTTEQVSVFFVIYRPTYHKLHSISRENMHT